MSFPRFTAFLALLLAVSSLPAAEPAAGTRPAKKKVAALIACWFPRSHPDVILARLLKTDSLDGKGQPYDIELVSVYRDLPDSRDITTNLANQYGFKVAATPEEALTLGTGKLAVDGVIICTEWAEYPRSDTGQLQYPHRRLFENTLKVFKDSGRVCPVFVDKHLADTWADSKWIHDQAKDLNIPLMAGSSVPGAWRHPPADVTPARPLKEIVGISYHTLDCYGFHGLEMVQALAEKRQGGETGVKAVRCLVSNAVWEAAGTLYDTNLLYAALARLDRPIPTNKSLQQLVKSPVLFHIEYADGLKVNLFTLNYAITQWAAAWKYDDGSNASTLFWLQETGSFDHFGFLTRGVERMILTGKPAWPAERTLMTSGLLDAALISKRDQGRVVPTPYLTFSYPAFWTWEAPPEPAKP
jgi:hypothetical protein